ncbi:restriction endonuclease [Kitasatospora sp. NPDC091335]|uniref:restriction endonuclease n=1 Tax=Kitasatospora sp. NPDC091335 TaxID=3364085 RepID=UPI00382082E6
MRRKLRHLGLRLPRTTAERVAAAVIALVVLSWALDGLRWAFTTGLPVLVAVAGLAAAGLAAWWWLRRAGEAARQQRLATFRLSLAQLDAMDDKQFEFALRDLLIRDGIPARQVGQQGDQAADVIGEDRLRGRIVVQAKHTKVGGKVGSQVMYQVKGTAGPVHHAEVAVVVTNGSFTRDAKAWGDKHAVHWVDRDALRRWAEGGVALPDLLRLPLRTARRGRLRAAA